MKALARAGDVDQVVALFAELRTSGTGKGDASPPNVLCYNTLVNALAEAGRLEEARVAFDEMLAAGVAPNASSLNILVKLHSWRSARFDLAYKDILRMRDLGVEADVGTYSTLVTGLCRAGRVGEAWGVLEWMLEEGCRPMVQTYTPSYRGIAVMWNGTLDGCSEALDRHDQESWEGSELNPCGSRKAADN
ncbi:hypothetical protein ACQ4PT_060895 [Festuca glaucescens]